MIDMGKWIAIAALAMGGEGPWALLPAERAACKAIKG